MAQDMTEIRWHGRGGQGAKTAAQLVAQVALEEGKHSQGFPEYGPERMGAPIRGFTRISDNAPIAIKIEVRGSGMTNKSSSPPTPGALAYSAVVMYSANAALFGIPIGKTSPRSRNGKPGSWLPIMPEGQHSLSTIGSEKLSHRMLS